MKSFTLSILFLSVALFSCQPQAEPVQEEVSNIVDPTMFKEIIQGLEDTLAMAYNTKNVELFSRFYGEQAITYGEGREQLFGKKAIVDHFRNTMMNDTSGRQFEYLTLDVFQEGDLAVENGKWIQLNAEGIEVDHGFYMVTYTKENNKWVSIRDIWNSSLVDQPAEE